MWWRWRQPLLLILLNKIHRKVKIPTKIPTNDRFRQVLYLVLYRIRLNKSVYAKITAREVRDHYNLQKLTLLFKLKQTTTP